jgi:hypothetical protein
MDNSAAIGEKQFRNLLALVEADPAEWREEELDDNVLERAAKGLGPCVGDDGPGPTFACPPASDVRLKHDVHRVGTTVFGLPLYHFKYIGEPETYEGVMAHEVLEVMPDAVSRGENGYYRVNYSALGTSMRRVS